MSNNNNNTHIIFILSNIYEVINGVSSKYIKFIEYLSLHSPIKNNIKITVLTPTKNIQKLPINLNHNTKFIQTKGLIVPGYTNIKVPTLNFNFIEKFILNQNEIIIFNGEFIWLYDCLISIKNKFNMISLYPNWHTDYEYYINKVYKLFKFSNSFIEFLYKYLTDNKFNGIIVTGELMKNKFLPYSKNIFNANELDLSIYNNYKIDKYKFKQINFIYTGRISKEKNIQESLYILSHLDNIIDFKFHIIGNGPYLNNIKNIIQTKYLNISEKIIFYNELKPNQIFDIYMNLSNRIFIFTSTSETFGKSPMEAGVCGIPIFIKSCDVSQSLYEHKKNAFLFDSHNSFLHNLQYFMSLNESEINSFVINSISNIKKYDQNKIFYEWYSFLFIQKNKKNHFPSFFDKLTLTSLTSFIQCSSSILDQF